MTKAKAPLRNPALSDQDELRKAWRAGKRRVTIKGIEMTLESVNDKFFRVRYEGGVAQIEKVRYGSSKLKEVRQQMQS